MQPSAAKILVLAPIPADALAPLRKRFELVDASGSPLCFLRSCPKPEHFEIAFTIGNCPLTREMIELLPALRYVCHYGVGTDQLALNALRERDVLVTNTAGASASCVADLALALLLSTIRQLPQGDAFVRGRRWREIPFPYGPSLGGRRIGRRQRAGSPVFEPLRNRPDGEGGDRNAPPDRLWPDETRVLTRPLAGSRDARVEILYQQSMFSQPREWIVIGRWENR